MCILSYQYTDTGTNALFGKDTSLNMEFVTIILLLVCML